MFGGFKGMRPHGGFRMSAAIVLFTIQLLGLSGYLGGFFERSARGQFRWRQFEWDVTTIGWTIAMWCFWAVVIVALLLSKEDRPVKVGGSVIASLPVVIFVFIFFELVKLGPG